MILTYEDSDGIRHQVHGIGAWARLRCNGEGVPPVHIRDKRTVTCLACAAKRS